MTAPLTAEEQKIHWRQQGRDEALAAMADAMRRDGLFRDTIRRVRGLAEATLADLDVAHQQDQSQT